MARLVLAALLAVSLLAGCGGDGGASKDPVSQVPNEGGLQEVRAAQQVNQADFPSAKGKSLQHLADEVKGAGSTEAGLASSVFTVGDNRLAFGMIDDQGQFVYGPTAVYVAPSPNAPAARPVRRRPPTCCHRAALPVAPGGRGDRPVRRRLRRRRCRSTRRARRRCWS